MVREERLQHNPEQLSFDQDALDLARQLQGATLVWGENQQAIILETEGFTRQLITWKIFDEAKTRKPGTIGRTQRIDGPGRVAKTLGIGAGDVKQLIVWDPVKKLVRLSDLN